MVFFIYSSLGESWFHPYLLPLFVWVTSHIDYIGGLIALYDTLIGFQGGMN